MPVAAGAGILVPIAVFILLLAIAFAIYSHFRSGP